MLLSTDLVTLDCQLSWLLSAETSIPLGHCLQSRAACLPLAQQQALILSASCLLSTDLKAVNNAELQSSMLDPREIRSKLLHLLEVLARSSSMCPARSTVHDAALMAVLQQHQPTNLHIPSHFSSRAYAAAPLPPWLTCSPQHCFSWLSSRATNTPAVPKVAAQQPPGSTSHAAQGETEHHAVAASADAVQQCEMGVGLPESKRVKLSNHVADTGQGPPQRSHVTAVVDAKAPDIAARMQKVLSQLQELHNKCDAGQLDVNLLSATLSAAARPGHVQQSEFAALLAQLQRQLEQLSVDALHPLLEALLTAKSGASSKEALSAGAIEYLLSTAVLPHIQHLGSAAPQALLLTLVAVAQSHLDGLVSAVLQPVLNNPGLLPVQVQLLTRVMKEAAQLPERVLHLLVMGALGLREPTELGAIGRAAFPPPGALSSYSCCWNASHAVLMRSLVDSHPKVVTDQLDHVVAALKVAAKQQELSKNANFGQLLMAVVKNFAGVFTKVQLMQLQEAVAATQTFMTKSVMAKLQQTLLQHGVAAADDNMQQ